MKVELLELGVRIGGAMGAGAIGDVIEVAHLRGKRWIARGWAKQVNGPVKPITTDEIPVPSAAREPSPTDDSGKAPAARRVRAK